MKKLKLLPLSLILVFSCHFSTVPIEIIEPKLNGEEKKKLFTSVSSLNLDSKENFYFIDNNIIKKMDSKGNVTIIGGKEKPDLYPEDGNIDGDVNSAKFSEINKMRYIENENTFYFEEKFKISENNINDYFYLVRKISNNKVETINNFGIINENKLEQKYYSINFINKFGEIYYYEYFNSKSKNFKIDKNNNKIEVDFYGDIEDNDGTFYSLRKNLNDSYELYILINGKWKKIIDESSIGSHVIKISIDNNNNLYIIEDTFEENLEHQKTSKYSPFYIYKVEKKEILKTNEIIKLFPNFLIGELSEYDGISITRPVIVSEDGNNLYGFSKNSIQKIKIGVKK